MKRRLTFPGAALFILLIISIVSAQNASHNESNNIELNESFAAINETLPANVSGQSNEELVVANETEPEPVEKHGLVATTLDIIVDRVSAFVGELINIQAVLRYANDSPVQGEQIDFYANEQQIGSEMTDSAGLAEIDWDTTGIIPGNYVISAEYPGDELLEGADDDVIVELYVVEEVNKTNMPENITEETMLSNISNVSYLDSEPRLATIVNEERTDTPYIKEYLGWHNNFTEEVAHKDIMFRDKLEFTLRTKSDSEHIKAIEAENKIYAIHLIACNKEKQVCAFRINGVPTKELHAEDRVQESARGFSTETDTPTQFSLADGYVLKIKSIDFSFCDHRRFCNRYYDAYDKVEVEIVNTGDVE